mmetsp:Transcript_1234/g.3778  ORF Transcript_1234/g.3778 Transcript_1234/m.3778 type:complete len:232 (+) Transcript_1234:343-1038(+)
MVSGTFSGKHLAECHRISKREEYVRAHVDVQPLLRIQPERIAFAAVGIFLLVKLKLQRPIKNDARVTAHGAIQVLCTQGHLQVRTCLCASVLLLKDDFVLQITSLCVEPHNIRITVRPRPIVTNYQGDLVHLQVHLHGGWSEDDLLYGLRNALASTLVNLGLLFSTGNGLHDAVPVRHLRKACLQEEVVHRDANLRQSCFPLIRGDSMFKHECFPFCELRKRFYPSQVVSP